MTIGAERSQNTAPLISNISWRTTGGFTTPSFGQDISTIEVEVSDLDGNATISYVNLTVARPDASLVVSQFNLTKNGDAGIWKYTTPFTLDQNGTYTLTVNVSDGTALNGSQASFTVSKSTPSITDGWYGIRSTSILSASDLATDSAYGFSLYEPTIPASNCSASWVDAKASLNSSIDLNIRTCVRFYLDYALSNSTGESSLLSTVSSNSKDLLLSPYAEGMECIVLEPNQTESSANRATMCNTWAQNISASIQNKYAVYCSDNLTGLNLAYSVPNRLVYIQTDDAKDLVEIQARAMRANSSLNRVYVVNGTSMNSTLLNISRFYNTYIIGKLPSAQNLTSSITDARVAELNDGSIIVHNNDSIVRTLTITLSGSKGSGYDVWDMTNKKWIATDNSGTISVTLNAYESHLLLIKNFVRVAYESGQWVLYEAGGDVIGSYNYTDATSGGSWGTSDTNYIKTIIWEPNYLLQGRSSKRFGVDYAWLNLSTTSLGFLKNPDGMVVFDKLIIADSNAGEISKLIGAMLPLGKTAEKYINVYDYQSNNSQWIVNKKAEVDAVLALNASLDFFINGLDYATIQNASQFPIDMKNLTDYVRITKGREATCNTYTYQYLFASFCDALMFESCVNTWTGTQSSSPTGYPRTSWSLMLNRTTWLKNHNVNTLCMAFSNSTNQSERENIYYAAKVLGYEWFYLDKPDFQSGPLMDYFPDLGSDLQRTWTAGTDGTYSRRYSNGIVYYNPTTELGWFVSGRQVNNIRLDALVYGGPGSYANITINDGQVYPISNTLLFSAAWVNITLNNTELANTGKFVLKSWSTTVNGITYWWDVVSGKGRNSYYSTDSGSTYTVYDEDKNWMFNLYMNESRTVAVDDLMVTQTNTSRTNGKVNLTMSSSSDVNLTVWSNPTTISGNVSKAWVSNDSGRYEIDLGSLTTDCDGASPTFTYTSIGVDSYGVCRKASGSDTIIRFAPPHLSNQTLEMGINTPPVITSVNVTSLHFYSTESISYTYGYTDAEGDPITDLSLQWFKNGAEQSPLANASTVEAGNLTAGDTWAVNLSIFDGNDWSAWSMSANATITSPPAPPANNTCLQETGSVVWLNGEVNCTGQDFMVTNSTTAILNSSELTAQSISILKGSKLSILKGSKIRRQN